MVTQENRLEFILGDETRPKVEHFEKQEDLEQSFFYDAYKKSFELIDKIANKQEDDKSNQGGEYYQTARNNIIAFVGERGSGKTSCLQTIFQRLQEEENVFKTTFKFDTSTNFLGLPTIDPSYFEEGKNILEIIIANMFRHFKDEANKSNVVARWEDNDSKYLDDKRDLVKKFQKVKDALDQINDKNTKTSNDSIEQLSYLATGTNMKRCMIDLLDAYLKYFKSNILVIAIDDIDIQTRYAFKMVEQIRKYLIIPKAIILIGVKLIQLSDIIKQNLISEYDVLNKNNKLSDSIENMVGRFLAKVIPYDHRIFLPDVKTKINLQKKIVIKVDEKTELEAFDSIDQSILYLIFRRTRYLFYNSATGVNMIVPRNLRDILHLVSLLYSMDEVLDNNNNKQTIINNNRTIFRNYFIETWCNEYLNSEQFLFIENLISSEVGSINKKIIDYLSEICDNNKVIYDSAVAYRGNRDYNISLGDINYFLDKVDGIKAKDSVFEHFVFALRTIYSMFLYDACENQKLHNGNGNEEAFNNRIGRKRHETSKALTKANKLSIYSDYERLLGGLLMKWGNPFKNSEKKINSNETVLENRHSLFHYHAINQVELRDIYKTEKGIVPLPILHYNICEFFLLNTFVENQSSFFRSFRHCYYDNLPHEIIQSGNDKPIIFHSLSILFNIVKYYYFYLHLSQDKLIESKNSCKQFWGDSLNKDSLIYKLLFYNLANIENKTDYEGNKEIEDIFIRNLEILDCLQDYLSSNISSLPLYNENIAKIHNKNTSADKTYIVNELKKLYENLSKFDYFLYPKENMQSSISIKKFNIFKVIVDFFEDLLKEDNADSLDLFNKIFIGNIEAVKESGEGADTIQVKDIVNAIKNLAQQSAKRSPQQSAKGPRKNQYSN